MRIFPQSLRTRLVVCFLLATLAPLAAVLYLSLRLADEGTERSTVAMLRALAEEKAARLDGYARENLRHVEGISTGVAFQAALEEFSASFDEDGRRDTARFDVAAAKFLPRVSSWISIVAVDAFYLIDTGGRIVYTSDPGSPLLGRSLDETALSETGLARALATIRTTRKPEITPPEIARDDTRPPLRVVGPILRGDTLLGFAAVDLPLTEIDEIVSDFAGLGATGDSFCVAQVGTGVVFTTPRRGDPVAASTLQGRIGGDFPKRLQQLALGESAAGRGSDTDGEEVFGAWVTVPTLGWGLAVLQHTDEVYATAHEQQRAVLSVASIAVVLAVFLGWLVARSVTRPIEVAAAAASELARGELADGIPILGSGEPRTLLVAMRDAEDSLVALLTRIRSTGSALGTTAHGIRTDALEQNELAQQFGSTSTEIAAAVREITATQQDLNGSVQSVAAAVRRTTESAASGRSALGRLSSEIDALALGASSVSVRLGEIRERAERIHVVVASMAKVANQTNLLAVNAAMEAERAGESGAGFRAVAREIRRLSAQTAEATLLIEGIVREMQLAVSSGVGDMERHQEGVDTGVVTVTRIGDELVKVIGGIEQLGNDIDLVARGMEAQALGVAQVSEAITSMTDGAARAARSASRFSDAGLELEERAKDFEREVGAFRLPSDRTPTR
jgi:methyl-accepting chemotaxis protein WspA